MKNRFASRLLGLVAGVAVGASLAMAAPVTVGVGGIFTSVSTPNPLGFMLGTSVSGSVQYDDSVLTGGPLQVLTPGDAGYGGFNLVFGTFAINHTDDSDFPNGFPGIVFVNGQLAGFDFLFRDFVCPGGLCDVGIGPGATGAGEPFSPLPPPNLFAFELNNTTQFAVGTFTFGEPGPDVPEPGTIVLLGTALLGLGVYRRRAKR